MSDMPAEATGNEAFARKQLRREEPMHFRIVGTRDGWEVHTAVKPHEGFELFFTVEPIRGPEGED